MVKAKEVQQVVEIKKINIKHTIVELIGDSSLIVHAWSDKAKKEMLDKMMKKAKGARPKKDPEQEYKDAFYRLPNGKPGFPAVAFKKAAVSAAGRFIEGMKMTEVRGNFHINGDLIEIIGKPEMREDMVRVSNGSPDIRYRPEFKSWRVKLPIRYNEDAISLEQIVNILNQGGFGVGVGEWRPEKNGVHGMFHVAKSSE